MRKVWINGEAKRESKATYHIYDEALMYGTVAFEMMRTFNKQTFRLKEHIDRLFNTLKVLEIQIPYTKEDIYVYHEALLDEHIKNFPEEDEWRTLINVSRGILPIYQPLLNDLGEPRTVMSCFPLRYVLRGNSWVYTEGVNVVVPSQRAIPQDLLDPKLKTRSRQHYKMADLEARYRHAWALLMDKNGFVAEGTGSNFFMVKDGKLYTPYGDHALRGISRGFLMEYEEVQEKNLSLYDAITADEAFFTNTPYCIVPIRSINGHFLDCPGPETKRLMDFWKRHQYCDFVKQAEAWDNE